MKLYKVGGCVRDELLGLKPKDIDYVYVSEKTNIDEAWEDLRGQMISNGYEVFLETKECFTIRARLGKEVADFVLARKERYLPDSRIPVVDVGSLQDDLLRRDFTLNALAQDSDGKIIDVCGGLQDLEDRILKCPLEPVVTFTDDPLRILRALRFSVTKNFTIDLSVLDSFRNQDIWSKFSTVSDERIREELFKMFKCDTKRSLEILYRLNEFSPGSLGRILNNVWLKPSLEPI